MPKFTHSDVLDSALSYLQSNGNSMTLCSAYPTTYLEATSTYMLAQVSLATTDYTIAAGDTSGRKVTVAQKDNVSVTNTGTVSHLAIVDTVNSKVLLVTEVATQSLTAGNLVNIPTFKEEIQDPV